MILLERFELGFDLFPGGFITFARRDDSGNRASELRQQASDVAPRAREAVLGRIRPASPGGHFFGTPLPPGDLRHQAVIFPGFYRKVLFFDNRDCALGIAPGIVELVALQVEQGEVLQRGIILGGHHVFDFLRAQVPPFRVFRSPCAHGGAGKLVRRPGNAGQVVLRLFDLQADAVASLGLFPVLFGLGQHSQLVPRDRFHRRLAQRLEGVQCFGITSACFFQVVLFHRQRAQLAQINTHAPQVAQFLIDGQRFLIFLPCFVVLAKQPVQVGEFGVNHAHHLSGIRALLAHLLEEAKRPLQKRQRFGGPPLALDAATQPREGGGQVVVNIVGRSRLDARQQAAAHLLRLQAPPLLQKRIDGLALPQIFGASQPAIAGDRQAIDLRAN